MFHATALEPRREPSGSWTEEWDRLPWLPDVRRPTRRRPRRTLLLALIGLVTADATGSYSLGKMSVEVRPIQSAVAAQKDAPVAATADRADAQRLAARISEAERIGWQLRRPNAPY